MSWLLSPAAGTIDLGDLQDVDLTGLANNDLLFRSGGEWIDTAGLLTWDGTSFIINDYALPTADGTVDQVIRTDGAGITSFQTINHAAESFGQIEDIMSAYTDFLEPPGGKQAAPLQCIVGGAGANCLSPLVGFDFTNHPGVWNLVTGTTAAGRSFLLSEFPGSMHVGVGGITRQSWWIETSSNLSTALERYVIRFGWFSMALPNTINEGIGFEYQDDQNGGRWQGICGDAPGVETSLDTGVTVTASTWFYLEMELNAAGTSVEFFIDEVSVGTIATNIPSGTGFGLFVSGHIMKLVGATSRNVYVDAFGMTQELTR